MDQNGIGYFDWMDLITNTYDDALQKAHVDLKFGDNRTLRNKELDFASGEWERIKFFKQRLPNTDDLCHVLDRFVDRMPEMEYGHRRKYRLSVAHEVAVDRWLKGKVFATEDRKYILDRERYLAEEYFNNDLNSVSISKPTMRATSESRCNACSCAFSIFTMIFTAATKLERTR